ncbi:MAG: hypothetical protein AAF902_07450 [Chloroflexota bacterium]
MKHTWPYIEGIYSPPAPVISVDIWHIEQTESLSVRTLVDSGSDITSVPQRYLDHLNVRAVEEVSLTGIHGVKRNVKIYDVWLKLASHPPVFIEVIGDQVNTDVILGRDVLNDYEVTLNGLASVTEIKAFDLA